LAAIVVGFCARQLVVYARIAEATIADRQTADFGIFYRSSQRLAAGDTNPYAPERSDPTRPPNLNPPHVVLALEPLAWLARPASLAAWALASAASAVWALYLIFQELDVTFTPAALAWTLFAVLAPAATGALLYNAQIGWVLWGPMTWAWARARHGRWTTAAIALGLITSVKPFVGLFVPVLAASRRLRPAMVAAATAVACFASGIAALGWPAFVSWMHVVRSVTWADVVFNASLPGLFVRLFTTRGRPIWNLAAAADAPALVLPLSIAAGTVVAAMTVKAAIDARPTGGHAADTAPAAVDRLFAATLAAALLITPLGWIYYEFLLAAPLAALCSNGAWRAVLGWRWGVLAIAGVCATLAPGVVVELQPSGLATATLGSAYFWSLLGVWLVAVTTPPNGRP
jgi:hypothetical protein